MTLPKELTWVKYPQIVRLAPLMRLQLITSLHFLLPLFLTSVRLTWVHVAFFPSFTLTFYSLGFLCHLMGVINFNKIVHSPCGKKFYFHDCGFSNCPLGFGRQMGWVPPPPTHQPPTSHSCSLLSPRCNIFPIQNGTQAVAHPN